MGKRKTPHTNDDDEYSLSESSKSTSPAVIVKRGSKNKSDFALGHIPDLPVPALDPANWAHLKRFNAPVKMAGALYRDLDEHISSWAAKYAVDDIQDIESELTMEQRQSIIEGLKGYCAPLSWKTLKDQLPESVYKTLPRMLAHAIISKDLHEKILCNPFYYLDDAYTENMAPMYFSNPPPSGAALHLKSLFRDMILVRRDDALKCRKLMLRCLHAPDARSSNSPQRQQFYVVLRKNAKRILVDNLLKYANLRVLSKTKKPTDCEQKDMAHIYSMADELCIGMHMAGKDMQFRYWRTLPLYDSHSMIMELAPVSKSADRKRKLAEKNGRTKIKQVDSKHTPAISRRFVALTLRPAFSCLTAETTNFQRPRPDEDEKVICKASVVLTKTEAPLQGGIFSNLPTGIREEYEQKCEQFCVYYDQSEPMVNSGIIPDLGRRSELPGDGPVLSAI
ncbi:hypothetical protein BJX64DRAFT_257662 [Aspergillus heterothallicus]